MESLRCRIVNVVLWKFKDFVSLTWFPVNLFFEERGPKTDAFTKRIVKRFPLVPLKIFRIMIYFGLIQIFVTAATDREGFSEAAPRGTRVSVQIHSKQMVNGAGFIVCNKASVS